MLEYFLFIFFLYFTFNYFNIFGIYGVPGSVQLNFFNIINYKYFCSGDKTSLTIKHHNNYDTIFGFCCRQLFNTFISNITKNNNNLIIGVSPIHHTSFKNIIENNFKKENIYIFDFDNYKQKIIIPDEIKNINLDLIVITHLWGKYLDIDEIKNNYKDTLIVEDVILGGKFKEEFNNNSDLLFHSCGMDKRPSSIFGGYVHINNRNKNIKNNMINSINNLPEPTNYEILKKITDTLLLYLIYNIRIIQNSIKLFLNLSKINLTNTIAYIRKNKPGFEHNNYMKRPTNNMIHIMKSIFNTEGNTEELFILKNKTFLSQFNDAERLEYFPWNKNIEDSCLPYNPIYIHKNEQSNFIKYFEKNNICILKNPTYKTFDGNSDIQLFLDNIIYLPCLYNLKNNEIINLTNMLKQYFLKTK